ncbi:DEAD/DEAH box helicase [Pseudomonas sp. WOUb67]|uniref:DEAD/DEAH box helicase n=1 Tax=Pseudomonas sp. WOUb67 TaxID=3161136 RepID=UPI003CEA2C82
MIQELADKIWSNPKFHRVVSLIESAWLLSELRSGELIDISQADIIKSLQAAAALASSAKIAHRKVAYRLATSIYELFNSNEFRLDKPLRVILTRLDNIPSLQTKQGIAEVGNELPLSLLLEEVDLAQERHVVFGDRDIFLTRFQYQLWQELCSKNSVIVSAPTSAGKSFVLQNFLLKYFNSRAATAIYIVPTRALIFQVSNDLRDVFEGYETHAPEITTIPAPPGEIISDNTLFVMTQERAQLLLLNHPTVRADLIVVDEAHSIGEGSRGVLLQNVVDELMGRNRRAQFMFACPMIENPDVFSRVFGLTDIHELTTDEPTVSQNFIKLSVSTEDDEILNVGMYAESGKYLGDITNLRILPSSSTRIDRMACISTTLGEGSVNIIYANGADEAERTAIAISKLLMPREYSVEREELAQLVQETVHNNYKLADCVRKGVAFHYGEVPSNIRRAIEDGVASGILDYLVCTSTLLQGVNLPARNIFLYKPEKGSNKPLVSTDFWNLAGRAGRLLKEFKGNIYLINYEDWKEQPLESAKTAMVVSSLGAAVSGEIDLLLQAMTNYRVIGSKDSSSMESVFSRLFVDLSTGRLDETLSRVGLVDGMSNYQRIIEALDIAEGRIKLPVALLKTNPNISPYKQQAMFDEVLELLRAGSVEDQNLIPIHPKHSGAYDSYVNIFRLCHRHIGGIEDAEALSRFHALIALRWMRGWPLSQIIDKQIERQPSAEVRTVIRESLGTIEQDMRYQAVRYFTCYLSVLKYAMEVEGFSRPLDGLIPVVLFLEVGASDATTISFISHGLSRATSKRLADKSKSKRMTPKEARSWLINVDLIKLDLPPIMMSEIMKIIRGWL